VKEKYYIPTNGPRRRLFEVIKELMLSGLYNARRRQVALRRRKKTLSPRELNLDP